MAEKQPLLLPPSPLSLLSATNEVLFLKTSSKGFSFSLLLEKPQLKPFFHHSTIAHFMREVLLLCLEELPVLTALRTDHLHVSPLRMLVTLQAFTDPDGLYTVPEDLWVRNQTPSWKDVPVNSVFPLPAESAAH